MMMVLDNKVCRAKLDKEKVKVGTDQARPP